MRWSERRTAEEAEGGQSVNLNICPLDNANPATLFAAHSLKKSQPDKQNKNRPLRETERRDGVWPFVVPLPLEAASSVAAAWALGAVLSAALSHEAQVPWFLMKFHANHALRADILTKWCVNGRLGTSGRNSGGKTAV